VKDIRSFSAGMTGADARARNPSTSKAGGCGKDCQTNAP
jgi:hypothetical protein